MSEKEQVKDLMKQVEEKKTVIAVRRDELRELISDVQDILESLDAGIEDIEIGLHHLQSGVDGLSQYL